MNKIEMTTEEFAKFEARLNELERENRELTGKNAEVCEALERARQAKIGEVKTGFKVSEKGAISVFGLGRFPVTLYWSQWGQLIKRIPDLEKFAEENKEKLATEEQRLAHKAAAKAERVANKLQVAA